MSIIPPVRTCDLYPHEFCLQPLRCHLRSDMTNVCARADQTPASIIEELTAPPGLRLLDGDSAAPTHADTAPVRTAQLLRWHGITRLDLPPERILDAAQADDDLRCVVVLGYKADGSEYFASSLADGADVLWLLERLKLQLLTTGAETDPT